MKRLLLTVICFVLSATVCFAQVDGYGKRKINKPIIKSPTITGTATMSNVTANYLTPTYLSNTAATISRGTFTYLTPTNLSNQYATIKGSSISYITPTVAVTLDDNSGDSPLITLQDGTNETTVIKKLDGSYTTIDTEAADGVQILDGSLKIGNGTPSTTPDGEDLYVEGRLEVTGGGIMSPKTYELHQSTFDYTGNDIAIASSYESNFWTVQNYFGGAMEALITNLDDRIKTAPGLVAGADTTKLAYSEFTYAIGGVDETEAAETALDLDAATDVADEKWGGVALDIDGSQNVTIVSAAGNAAGYDSALLAATALQDTAVTAASIRFGYIVVKDTAAGFVWNTDALVTGGTVTAYLIDAPLASYQTNVLKLTNKLGDYTSNKLYMYSADGEMSPAPNPALPLYMSATFAVSPIGAVAGDGFMHFAIGISDNRAAGAQPNLLGLFANYTATTGAAADASVKTEIRGAAAVTKTLTGVSYTDGKFHKVEFYIYGTDWSVKVDGTLVCSDGDDDDTPGGALMAIAAPSTWTYYEPTITMYNGTAAVSPVVAYVKDVTLIQITP